MEGPFRYYAFISYSHADEAIARWLHKGLETYRVPSRLVGKDSGGVRIPRRLFPIFRDREELSSSASLAQSVEDALSQSRALIVIASPSSAQSRWVNEEIRRFKALGGKRVLCLIVEGEPNALENDPELCLAPSLRFEVNPKGELSDTPAEPLAADIRSGADSKRSALLKLIAGILDLGLDELKQREHQRRVRRMAIITGISLLGSAFTTSLAVVAFQARDEAQKQRNNAELQRQRADERRGQAEDLIGYMLGNLHDKLKPIGRLDVLDSLSEMAVDYFGKVRSDELTDKELSLRAEALRQLGNQRVEQGDLDAAAKAFQNALDLDSAQVMRHPNNAQTWFNIGQSQFYIGYDLFLRGKYRAAAPWFSKYAESAEKLLEFDPHLLKWQVEKQYALDTAAVVQLRLKNHRECLRLASKAEEWGRKILREHPNDPLVISNRTNSLNKAGVCAKAMGDLAKQIEFLREIVAIRQQLLDKNPADSGLQFHLAVGISIQGTALLAAGRFLEAGQSLTQCQHMFSALTRHDPNNAKWRSFANSCDFSLASLHIFQNNFTLASEQLDSLAIHLDSESRATYDKRAERADHLDVALVRLLLAHILFDEDAQADLEDHLTALLSEMQSDSGSALIEPLHAQSCAILHIVQANSTRVCLSVNPRQLAPTTVFEKLLAQSLQARAERDPNLEKELREKLHALSYHSVLWHLLDAIDEPIPLM